MIKWQPPLRLVFFAALCEHLILPDLTYATPIVDVGNLFFGLYCCGLLGQGEEVRDVCFGEKILPSLIQILRFTLQTAPHF